jgi:transposase
MKPITDQQKRDIIAAFGRNQSLRSVSRCMNIGYGTVWSVVDKAGLNVPGRKTGRPSTKSEISKRRAIRAITSGKANSAVDVQKMHAVDVNIKISAQAVRKMIKDAGLKAAHRLKKPLLTSRDRRH